MDFDQHPDQSNTPGSSNNPFKDQSDSANQAPSQVKLNPFATAADNQTSDPSKSSFSQEQGKASPSLSYHDDTKEPTGSPAKPVGSTDAKLVDKILLTTGPLFLLVCLIISLIMISQ